MKPHVIRILSSFMTMVCLAGMPMVVDNMPWAIAFAEEQQAKETYIVNADFLNVRSGPGIKHPIVARLTNGTEITGQKSEDKWWQVNYANGSGYVDAKYLRKKAPDSKTAVTTDEKVVYRSQCNLRMREKPSLNGKVLGVLKKGTRITLISREGEWSEINHKGKTAWVATLYLEKVE